MTLPPPLAQPPEAILLATDLSARCDRARDRAVQLARRWRARLVAVTVAPAAEAQQIRDGLLQMPPWARRESPEAAARRRLERDLADSGVVATCVVEQGEIGPAVVRAARSHGCGLIVAGVARNAVFRPPTLGSTGQWLARRAPVPVLVVHGRVREAYRRVAVSSDFSATAGHALELTAACFGDEAEITLLHGANTPSLALLDRERSRQAVVEREVEHARSQASAHLDAAALPAGVRERIAVVVEPADPERLLQTWIHAHDADLVVVGSHGRSALFDVLLGSVAQRILDSARVDTLIVPEPNARRR